MFLKPIWLKYSKNQLGMFHFDNNKQRLEAIELILKELENGEIG